MDPNSSTGSAVDAAKDAASDAVDTAKDKAGDLLDQAKSTATDKLDAGKEQATGLLGNAAEALHDTADALREHDNDAFARYADAAADQVAQFTDSLRGKSVGELLDEAERFARRDAGLFLGGAFVLGIFGARFLKAATPQRSSEGRRAGYVAQGQQRYASGTYDGRTGGYGASGYGASSYGMGAQRAGPFGAGETRSGLPSGASRAESRTGTPSLPSTTDPS